MAAQDISDRTADSFNGNRPLRVVPVIPAVPRQFEKKLTNKIVSGEQTRRASNASSQKGGPSQKDLADSPVKRESINDSMLESEGRLAKHTMLHEGHQGQHSKTDFIPNTETTMNICRCNSFPPRLRNREARSQIATSILSQQILHIVTFRFVASIRYIARPSVRFFHRQSNRTTSRSICLGLESYPSP